MTITEMHTRFRIGVDKLDTLSNPNLSPEVVDELLNQAQERLVKQRMSGINTHRTSFEETQKRTDDIRILITDETITPTTTAFVKPNAVAAELPTSPDLYWFTINEEAEVVYKDCTDERVETGDIENGIRYIVTTGSITYNSTTHNAPGTFLGVNGVTTFTGSGLVYTASSKRVEVKPVRHNNYNKLVRDPFNKPNDNQVLRMAYQGYAELIGDGTFVITAYYLRFIRKPVAVSYTGNPQVNCELSDHLHDEIVSTAVAIALEEIESGRYQTNLNELLKQE